MGPTRFTCALFAATQLVAAPVLAQSDAPTVPALDDIIPGWSADANALSAGAAGPSFTGDIYPAARQSLRLAMVWRLADEGYEPEMSGALGGALLDTTQPVNWDAFRRALPDYQGEVDALIIVDELLNQQLTAASEASLSPAVREAQAALLTARVKYDIRMLEERAQVIELTNLISWFIFIVAHVTLGVGLWAAVREFLHAAKTRNEAPTPSLGSHPAADQEPSGPTAVPAPVRASPPAADLARADNEIRISLEGVALKTSLHGVLLLCVAIGFYFLYLKFVYPITLVGE
jgi:hypothetical protein